MKKIAIVALCLLTTLSILYSFKSVENDGVKGWFLAGSKPENYQIGVEKNSERDSNVAYLKSVKVGSGFGTIMQSFVPKDYLGKRVKLTGSIKSKDITDWAGMWFRIDGEKNKSLGFDNMQNRPIKGTTAWREYSIVLDVPNNSQAIAYGVLLSGPGHVWMDDLKFEIVDKSVPLTTAGSLQSSEKPSNTNFEDTEK